MAKNPRNCLETTRGAQRIRDLISNTNYRFAIRAGADRGTKGFGSETTSDRACVSTFPPGARPVAWRSPTAAKAPQIAVDRRTKNEPDFEGVRFTLNASVSVPVADPLQRSVRRDAKANGNGDAFATSSGLCQSQGWLFISTTAGRAAPLSVDKAGFQVLCT